MAKNKEKKTPVEQEDTTTDESTVVQDEVAVEELQAKIQQLEKKLKDQQEITQRAQSDYYRLKMDWDQYVTRTESMKANLKVESLISTAQKLLPAVSQLKQTVATMPDELAESPWAQ
jgi:molecular chaperone GrpE (heat shock protein)